MVKPNKRRLRHNLFAVAVKQNIIDINLWISLFFIHRNSIGSNNIKQNKNLSLKKLFTASDIEIVEARQNLFAIR